MTERAMAQHLENALDSESTSREAGAGFLFQDRNEAVRPQDDLFQHVNGAWLDRHEIPADRGVDGAFMNLRDQAEADLRRIIEDASVAVKENDAEETEEDDARSRRIGQLYSLFMDEEGVEKLGSEPLQPLFAKIDAASSVEEFLDVAGSLHRSGMDSPVHQFVSIDPSNPGQYRLFILQGGIFLPDESYYREEQFEQTRADYLKHLAEFLPLVGLEEPGAPERILALETLIASGHWDKVATRDAVARNNPFSAAEFAGRWPLLDRWLAATGGSQAQRERLLVWQPDALDSVSELLVSKELDDWKLWLKHHVAHGLAPYLSSEIVRSNWEFVGRTLQGSTEQRERWKRGVAFVEGSVGEDLGALFVAEHFPASSKERMLELVDYLVRAYRESISSLTWMSEGTRARALEKLGKFVTKIGYPQEWIDYSGVRIVPGQLVATALEVSAAAHDRDMRKLDGPVNSKEWLMTPQTVNAYYMPTANEIVFPAAILRPPFFDPQADAALNFAGIGAVIGHEIGHGFDDQGSRYDGDGELTDWWEEEDREAFIERTKRLVDQYEGLRPLAAEDARVNGELTLGENIGDLGGLSIGYKAYVLYLADRGLTLESEAEIEGLSAKKRFFYSWATIWRSKSRPETARQRVATDPHSPAEFRANEPAKNLDAFHEAFETKPGDGMYLEPQRRVKIW